MDAAAKQKETVDKKHRSTILKCNHLTTAEALDWVWLLLRKLENIIELFRFYMRRWFVQSYT